MTDKSKKRDSIVVVLAWLIAAALIYVAIIKFKLLLHK